MSWGIIAALWIVGLVAVRAIMPGVRAKKAVSGIFVLVPVGLFFHYRSSPGESRHLIDAIIIAAIGLGAIDYFVRGVWPRKFLQSTWIVCGLGYYIWVYDDSDGAFRKSFHSAMAFGPGSWIVGAVLVMLLIVFVAAADRGIDHVGQRAKEALTGKGKTL